MASTNDSIRHANGAGPTALDGLIRRFDEAWQRGDRPSIPDFLDSAGGQPTALVALVHHDLKHRLESGEAARVEHYLEGFPELREDNSFLMDLLATEYDVRKSRDGDFPMAEYVSRFPQMAADIISYLIGPKRRDHTLILEKDQSKAVTESPGLQNTIIEPSLSAMVSQSQEQAETLFHSDSKSDSEQQPAAPRTNVPGYEILGELGRGGMGVVYKARQISLKRLVALKMIISGQHAGQKDLARFQGEAEVLAKLHNPHIVQIYDINEHEGFPYFALEYIDGGTLSDKVAGKPMDPREAAELMRSVAVAVHSAHKEGIVHRDLKPDNVLLTTDGVPKITDFGLAKSVKGDSARTQTGTVMGTPGYMAPEQALGKTREVGPSSDQYSLGAILYEMLTGRPPFRGETPVDTMLLVVSEDPQPLTAIQPGVPRDLETICLKCLQKEIDQRYASCRDFADELTRFLENEPILARPISRAQRLARWCRRNAAMVSVSGLAAALFLGLAGALVYKANNPEQVTRIHSGMGVGPTNPGDNDPGAELPPQDASMEKLVALEKEFDGDLDAAKLHQIQQQLREIAEQKEPPPGEMSQQRGQYLETLAQARSADPAIQKAAVEPLKALLANPAVHRPDRLCDALTRLAQARPAAIAIPDAVNVLRSAAEGNAVYAPAIRDAMRVLQTEQVQHDILQPKIDWNQLLNVCKEADKNNNWVKAAKAEALLETAGAKPSAQVLNEVREALPPMLSPETPEGAYAAYVQSLWFAASKRSLEAAKHLRTLAAQSPLPLPLTLPSRQARAIEILASSVDESRTTDADPFRSPFKADAINDVYATLKSAFELCTTAQVQPTNAMRFKFALAAWFKTPRDAERARNLLAQISTQGLKEEEALPIRALQVQVRQHEPARKETVIEYANLLEPLRTYLDKKNVLWEPAAWYENIVKPGIELGTKLNISRPSSEYPERHALAMLYMQKGLLIGQDAAIVPSDPYKHMKEAFEKTLALDEKLPKFDRATCILQADVAQMWIKVGDDHLKKFEQDAKMLTTLEPKFAGSHYLFGYVRATEARREAGKDLATAIKHSAEAKEHFSKAIDLLRGNDPFSYMPVYYLERSYNSFNWAYLDPKKRIQLFQEAAEDARAALRLNPSRTDNANAMLGNALEELAWYSGKTENYAEAVAAFEDARLKDQTVSKYWIGLARCKFKCLKEEAKGTDSSHAHYLGEAIKHLETILDEEREGKRSMEPALKAEANFWFANLQSMNHKPTEAEKGFDAVVALAGKPKTQSWVAMARFDGADNLLKQAEANRDSKSAGHQKLLDKARSWGVELSKMTVSDAARNSAHILGRIARLENKPQDAVEKYLEAFKKEPPRADEPTIRLGGQLLDLMTDQKSKVDLRGKKLPEGADKEAIAALGDKLAKLSDEVPIYRGGMYGLAGLAHMAAVNFEDPKQQERHRTAARNLLEVAVQATPKDAVDGWRWRYELAQVYRDLWKADPKTNKDLQDKAHRLAEDARGGQQVPATKKNDILKLMKELQPKT